MLCIVPGLGHLYKGHLLPGLIILCVLGPAYLAIVFLLVPVTFGLSLLLPAIFVVISGMHAYRVPNVRKNPGVLEQARQTAEQWFGPRPKKTLEH